VSLPAILTVLLALAVEATLAGAAGEENKVAHIGFVSFASDKGGSIQLGALRDGLAGLNSRAR
jgi:hypothetical protein